MDFRETIQHRRSYYHIEKKSPVSDEKIVELVEFAALHTPSPYNCPSQKVVILLGEKHDQLWDIVMESLRKVVPPKNFAATQVKINGFKAGYGTILFFIDENVTKALQEKYSLYADTFELWAHQTNGSLQFAIWNILESEGFGASLQHYNPLIDSAVGEAFDIPKNLRLIAQMPFGAPTAQPDTKEFAEIKAYVKLIK